MQMLSLIQIRKGESTGILSPVKESKRRVLFTLHTPNIIICGHIVMGGTNTLYGLKERKTCVHLVYSTHIRAVKRLLEDAVSILLPVVIVEYRIESTSSAKRMSVVVAIVGTK